MGLMLRLAARSLSFLFVVCTDHETIGLQEKYFVLDAIYIFSW